MDIKEYRFESYGPLEEAGFKDGDILEIVHWREGENDYESWLAVLKLSDGQWCYVEAWCDYTGWDCRAGAETFYASTEEELVRNCLTQEARHIFGYDETPDCGV